MGQPLKIAIVMPDDRDEFRCHAEPWPRFGAAPAALLAGLAALPECEVHVVCCIQQPVTAPAKLGPNIFYHAEIVPKWGWMRGGYLGCIRAVRRRLQKIRPDIVHGQGTERYGALAAAFSGFPSVVTLHGNMPAIAKIFRARFASFHWCAARLETLALKKTAGVLCNSAYTEKLAAPRAKKTWRVPNALRPAFFEGPAARRGDGPPVLLNIGSMLAYKQPGKILEVAGALWRRGFKFEMHFVGDRALQSEYGAAFAARLAAAERAGYARHLGMLDTPRLLAALDAAAALVHFPLEESFGLVVAEALARNLKFFGAATGGVPDIAGGVDGAELFPATDFPALESALARWLAAGCPPPRAAAAVMRARYHPAVVARRHLEIYREVLAQI